MSQQSLSVFCLSFCLSFPIKAQRWRIPPTTEAQGGGEGGPLGFELSPLLPTRGGATVAHSAHSPKTAACQFDTDFSRSLHIRAQFIKQ